MELMTLVQDDVLNILPDRDPLAHKGDFGKILLLCGSEGYTGAAALAAMGALRSGAGLVYLGVPKCIYAIEAVKLLEPIVFPLADRNGMFSEDAILQIDSKINKMDAILIGPGIGQSEGCFSVVKYVLENFQGPIVLDADGINLIAEHKDIIRRRTSPTIMTPHYGEFRRIGGILTGDRVSDAVNTAKDLGVTIVLKGHASIITNGAECYINNTGNPGMAVGGSGDILAGMILSFLGQGISPLKSAACAAWLHGAAGDLCAHELGQYGMIPSDLLEVLPRLMK